MPVIERPTLQEKIDSATEWPDYYLDYCPALPIYDADKNHKCYFLDENKKTQWIKHRYVCVPSFEIVVGPTKIPNKNHVRKTSKIAKSMLAIRNYEINLLVQKLRNESGCFDGEACVPILSDAFVPSPRYKSMSLVCRVGVFIRNFSGCLYMKNWLVYILECSDGTLYCGATNDLDKREKAHNKGKGAKYTKSRRPVVVIESRVGLTRSQALSLEHKVKKQKRENKCEFLRSYKF